MNNYIHTNCCTISQNPNAILSLLKTINFNNEVMVFISKNCYEFIKNKFTLLSDPMLGYSSKVFVTYDSDSRLSFVLTPMYSGEWFFIEKISSVNEIINTINTLPTKITFISFEDESFEKIPNANIITAPSNRNPIDCIMNDYHSFENSLIVITKAVFLTLAKSTVPISQHKGIYRLSWACDNNYPGSSIMLKSFNNENYYLIESMQFLRFYKCFSITDFPKAIHFII